ncbi:MAG: hypothetical protein ACK56F_05930 [bacterium]
MAVAAAGTDHECRRSFHLLRCRPPGDDGHVVVGGAQGARRRAFPEMD